MPSALRSIRSTCSPSAWNVPIVSSRATFWSREQRRDSLAHLLGRLVRERDRADLSRRHALREQVRDAKRDHAGLARASAASTSIGPSAVARRLALRRIELAEIDHGPSTLRILGRAVNANARLRCYRCRGVRYVRTLVDALRAEFPRLPHRAQGQSRLHRAIHRRTASSSRSAGCATYLDSFQTTIGSTVYVTPDWDDWEPDRRYVTLRHEAIHLRQFRTLYAARDGGAVPAVAVAGRARLVSRAASRRRRTPRAIRAAAEVWGSDYPRRPTFATTWSRNSSGPSYGWMWPFRTRDRTLVRWNLGHAR